MLLVVDTAAQRIQAAAKLLKLVLDGLPLRWELRDRAGQ
jgi:hypothetical protein